jgi:lipoprotein-anchoring transpeptidase ErfK/SrfK
MIKLSHTLFVGFVSIFLLNAAGCDTQRSGTAMVNPSPTLTPSVTPTPVLTAVNEMPMTLPVLDAFFYNDQSFPSDLKTILLLTDDQVSRLREVAREETSNLRESMTGAQSEYQGSTIAAADLAKRRVAEITGEDKYQQLSDFVLRRWRNGVEEVGALNLPSPTPRPDGSPMATVSPSPTPEGVSTGLMKTHLTPSDTRIVVNAPAHRMDVFESGRLIKSYKIGIGYPEFPLPTGERRATSIVFNPTWTPPDEPWVESSNKVRVGEKVGAGSKLNPLGVIKVPIGLPSLIHGGKAPTQLGKFSSHGCVGMTNKQVQDFAQTLAKLGSVELTKEEIAKRQSDRTKTQSVKLNYPVPVELRYETIVIEDGKLHIYRDVYERGTNTRENLSAVLSAYDVTLDQLSEDERLQVQQALKQMSRGPGGTPVEETTAMEKEQQKQRNIERGKLTRIVRGEKEIVIEIAALKGKGSPAPLEIDTGGVTPAVAERSAAPRSRGR